MADTSATTQPQANPDLAYVKGLSDPYAKYSGFANDPLTLNGFSPEVVAALKANENGGKNIIIGGKIAERDPAFSYTPTSPVTTSGPQNTAVDNLGKTGVNLANNPPNVIPGTTTPSYAVTYNGTIYNDPNSLYTARSNDLQARRDQEVAGINSQFDTLEKSTGNAQVNETGTTTRNLLRMGGSLGGSASEQGSLLKLEATHRDEMTALTAKRTAAVQAAQNAFNDKDFQNAQEQYKAVQDMDKEIYQRNKDFLDYTQTLKSSARADAQLELQKQTQQRDFLKQVSEWGVTQPFFELAGHVYDAQSGEVVKDKETALKLGIKPDMSNVQVVSPPKNYSSGIVGEYQFYVDEQKKAGKQPVDFNSYQNMDANRKIRIASAGQAAALKYAEDQKKKDAVNEVLGQWNKGYIQGNGTVSSKDYRVAKEQWVSTFGNNTGKEFDDNFKMFVDSTGSNWASNYGTN